MKKKLLITLLFVLSFGIFAFYFSNTKEVEAETSNGYRVEEVYSDKFNKEELDSSWKLNDATVELNYCGIHCISPVGYGYGPNINRAHLSDRTIIKFTIYPQSGQTETNISFNIGMESPNTEQKEPNVDCKVQFWNNQLVFTDWQHNLAPNQEKLNDHVLREFNGLYSDLVRTDITLVIERISNTLTQIYAEYRRDGELVYSSQNKPFELSDPRCPYGYCGFFWDVVEMDVTNFEWYNDDVLVFEDNLTENTLTYPSTNYELGNFHVNTSLNESNVYVSRVSSVKMDSNNESIVNKNELVKLDNVSTPYKLGYELKFNELANDSFFGFGFGLKDEDLTIDSKNAIGFIKKDSLTAEVVILRNGKIDRSNSYQVAITKLGNGKYINCSIDLNADHTVNLTINGLTYKFSNIDFFGQTGVGLVSLNEENTKSSSVEMRAFSLERNVYNKYASEDAENDFMGTSVPDPDDPLFTEPYINDQKYYLGTNVTLEEDWSTGEANLIFSSANPYSSFGYCKEYSEWICEFDIDVLSRAQNQYIGLSFGRKSIVDVLAAASYSNNTYLLRCDGTGASTAQVTFGANCKFDDGTTSKSSDVNVFSKTQTKYHFMFVGKNRTVYVYYKAADAPDTELAILRSKMTNVNIDGYVAVVGNNNASFSISNFKMVNLSDECTKESTITLRESFNSLDTVSEKIVLDPMCDIVDGKLVMSNATVKTASEKLYEIIRFTTFEIENTFQVQFSKNKKIIFDSKNNKITIREGVTTTEYDCSEINLKNIKNKRFEIIIQGDQVTIGYKGYYDPQDKLSTTVITHKVETAIEKDYISFSANGEVTIDDLYLFSLDNSELCNTYNYEDDPNNEPLWKVKPDFDPSKVYDPSKDVKEDPVVDPAKDPVEEPKGCTNSIGASLAVLSIVGIIPILVLRKKEEK